MRVSVTIVTIFLAHGFCFDADAQQSPIVPGAERIAALYSGASASEGRVLLGELGCASCHAIDNAPEFGRESGPDLAGIGTRMKLDYLGAWLDSPHEMKPGTVMPDVIPPGAERVESIQALRLFLSVDVSSSRRSEALTDDETEVERGEALYHSVGCVACHAPFREPTARIGGDDEFSEQIVEHQAIALPSVPLPNLPAKTNYRALTEFLMDPLAVRSSGRMPNMKLNPEEAKAIAGYLLSREDPAPNRVPVWKSRLVDMDDYVRGRELFTELRCIACHSNGSEFAQARVNLPVRDLDAGCLSEVRVPSAPWFGLADRQRESIRLALAEDESPTRQESLREHLASLNCIACHVRDELGGVENGRMPYFAATIEADLGDEGRIPPPLTGVGAKLTEKGLVSMLVGDASVRSYMATRMPRFGEPQTGELPSVFLELDVNPNAPEIDVSGLQLHHRNLYGRDLLGTSGFGCVGCHNLYGAKSLGIPAIDLATVPDRIQPSWFKQYLLDPNELRPGTRMPTYFEDGKSPVARVLRGNVDQQIEAMWIYLREIDQTRLPEGMEDRGNFELIPTDRPILLRTFMTDVGTHAIAVGYPEGVHVAFDALEVRLVIAWHGKFMDAESTWADRFSPLASPMSEERFLFPAGPAVVFAQSGSEDIISRFRGYRLDEKGIPTFLYSISNADETVRIEETIRIADDRAILRTFKIEGNVRSTLRVQSPPSDEVPVEVAPSSEAIRVEQIWRPQW